MATIDTAHAAPGSRGTIILDATALVALLGKIAPERQEGASIIRHYLDFLPVLAQHGYRIIIPEVAALAVGQVFADGRALGRMYQHPDGSGNKYIHSEKVVLPFLRSAAAGDTGITILPETGPEEVDAYCKRLYDAYTRPAMVASSGKKEAKQENANINRGLLHRSVRNVLGTQPKQASAKAVMALLARYAPDGVPTVLTDNRYLSGDIDGHNGEVVTSANFIASLVDSGLWAQYGLTGTPQEVVDDCIASYKQIGGKSCLVSEPQVMDAEHLSHLGKGAFAQGIAGIAAGNPLAPPTDAPPLGYPSPLDKFRQRYGNQGKTGNGRG